MTNVEFTAMAGKVKTNAKLKGSQLPIKIKDWKFPFDIIIILLPLNYICKNYIHL